MFNYRILGIIKRELKEKLLSKSFILTTIMFPVLLFVIGGVQALLVMDEATSKLNIVCEDQKLTQSFQKELSQSDLMKEGKYSFEFFTMNREGLKKHLDDNKKAMLDDKLTGVVFIPATALTDKRLEYYSKSPNNISLSRKIEGPINKVLIDAYFTNKALSAQELDYARKGVDFNGFKVSKEESIKEEGFGSLILSYVFAFLLYISLLMSGQMMLQSVIEEKSSRIVEVILSSVSPREMMTGKIVGSAITALLQMSIWLAAIITVASSVFFALPAEVVVDIKAVQVIFLLVNFAVGLVLFLSLFGMVGSIFDNPQDAQSGMWPVMMLIMIPFFVAMSMMQNPNSPIGNVTALLPFTSIMVMPVKMTIVEVPIWQLALSIVVNIVAIFFVFPIAGKIYRVGILRTGKKPKWSEVVKWLKYKY
ncbi:MAG: ABC-type transporter permease protein [Stygiobacter sp.]|nr:MAG: ABC-type transporter permease protein [Stygiobacter sp.]KAF0218209.1 MAG: ABC-type transporter permease [Ignavibacteria bacterium]